MLLQVFSYSSENICNIFEGSGIGKNISGSAIATCCFHFQTKLCKSINESLEHEMHLHELSVIILVLFTNNQLNFGQFIHQSLPLIEILD